MSTAFSKPPFYQSAKYLNNVNDSQQGGALTGMPSAVGASQAQQNVPGDRIVLDDATALALSDTASTGTLYGGVYMYVVTLSSSTASPARGAGAFFRQADIGSAVPSTSYTVTADAQPSAAVPAFCAGVFINAITKGNLGFIQVAGIATCLYDAAAPTDATAGRPVFLKISPTTAGSFDAGLSVTIATTVTQVPLVLGTAIETPANAGLKQVAITRAFPRW